MKNKSFIFAASKPNSILLISKVAAIFFAAYIGLSTLADCCTLQSVIEFGDLGGDSLSYFNFSFAMPNSMKNYSGTNNSNANVTSAHETGKTLYPDFLIEKNAKNRAYHFILSHGLLTQFADYCSNVQLKDPHAACISILKNHI